MTKWEPKNNTKFWYIDSDCTVCEMIYWVSFDTDYRMVQAGNCFPSREKAEEALNKIKQVLSSEQYDENNKEKELPKLTMEVFDHPDCPVWANYAAIDEDGKGFYFRSEPKKAENAWQLPPECNLIYISKFDASDWENSLIKRPPREELPDWVKVDNIGWHNETGYFKIIAVDDIKKEVCIQHINSKIEEHFSFDIVRTEAKYTRPLPFNDKEMQGLVGKTFTTTDGYVSIATDFDRITNSICICSEWFTNKELADSTWQLDGKPCHKFEHQNDKGGWIE